MNIYYVYAYLNQNTGLPYYIGKGQGDRINAPHLNLNLPPKLENRIILKEGLTEDEALKQEILLISHYGRKDLGTGILLNRTNGGDGGDTSMYRQYEPMSDETRQRLSESKKGSVPWNKGMKGIAHLNPGNRKPKDVEYRRKISETLKGQRKGIPQKKLTCPHCGKEGGANGMKRWHYDNCKEQAKEISRMRRG